jgi:hypothetical protein
VTGEHAASPAFRRPEPALIIGFLSAALSVGTALHFDGLSAEQVSLIVAVINAALAAVVAARVRPVAPAAFTGLVGAVVALTAAYGFDVSREVVGAVDALVVAGLAMLTRPQVTAVGDRTVL